MNIYIYIYIHIYIYIYIYIYICVCVCVNNHCSLSFISTVSYTQIFGERSD